VVVERLRDVRVDPSANDNEAIEWAATNGHLAVVDRLLEDDRVDVAVALRNSRPEHLKRFECRERLTEICFALQAMQLPAWVTVQILDAARPWSTLPLHSKWSLVCSQTMSSSSSSVAAPAVVDKHAELLKMVNKCTHYKCTLCDKREKKSFFSLIFFPPRHTTQWCARSARTATWL
jgi:hypothetical protein